MAEWIFIDLEWNTTFYKDEEGQRVPFHELLEIAAVKVDSCTGLALDSFHSYIHPTVSPQLQARTYELLPYTPEVLTALLKDAPTFPVLMQTFVSWCGPHPVFVEWGNNDVDVLRRNLAFHHIPMDADWACGYYDLQYVYQKRREESMSSQPSLEKAVNALGLPASLDFHSAWNDVEYTIRVYRALQEQEENFTLFRRPPKPDKSIPLCEKDLGCFNTRWACKNHPDAAHPRCPLCGGFLRTGKWVRTTPAEQLNRCYCPTDKKIYMVVTTQQEGQHWRGKATLYREFKDMVERYQEAVQKPSASKRRPWVGYARSKGRGTRPATHTANATHTTTTRQNPPALPL